MIAMLATLFALQGAPTRVPRSAQQSAPPTPAQSTTSPRSPGSTSPRTNGATPHGQQGPASAPLVPPKRFGRFELDVPKEQFARLPDLKECADALAAPSGHAECSVPREPDGIARVQIAWEDSKAGGEIVALRLVFDPQTAPALTELEWQLTRGWGAPSLEQLRRERDQKLFTLQWEDAEHRATLEAQGPLAQPSRATAVVLERKQVPLSGEFTALHPRPFPGFRLRWIRRVEWDGQTHAVLWGSSLTPAQEAMGEISQAWATQRNYVGIWKLEPATSTRPRRWKPLWERVTG